MTGGFRLPPVIGHRGAAAVAPENTLAGFARAAQLGVAWVEIDARLTADGRCVVFHDETLERIAGVPSRVDDVTLSVLSGLDAGVWFDPVFAGQRVPTLDAALVAIGGLGLGVNIELKRCRGGEARLVEEVAGAVSRNWPPHLSPPLISSFDGPLLARSRDMVPQLPRALIIGRLPGDWRATAARLVCVAVHCRETQVTAARISRIKAAGYAVAAFVVDDPGRARELWDWGIDTAFTDCPGPVLAAWRAGAGAS
ncbi:MAG: glycerophosphodiester phosphodiesterase family protein [Rhodospirillales bacterium]|nr:glycerophosphodiester phosphodiesterase family protein [Rhodospirillales bacterium]